MDLDKTRDIYNNTVSVLKHLNLDGVNISGNILPFTGWMLAHRGFMNIFHRHLNRDIANKSPQELLRFKKRNSKNLALIHILSLFCTGVISIGFGQMIKNNINYPIGLPSISKGPNPMEMGLPSEATSILDSPTPKENNESSSNSKIIKSLLPIFIIKKFKSFKNYAANKKLSNITISIIIYILFYIITIYFPILLIYINYYYNYKTFGYLSIFVTFYIIYTLFELLIVYFFVIDKPLEKLENNKFSSKLPKYIKREIDLFRKYDSTEDKDLFKKQYFMYILIHLISLIISFVLIIICLIIF